MKWNKQFMIIGIIFCILVNYSESIAQQGIQIYKKNPHYWQYNGNPILLLGGSDDDNIFQWPKKKLVKQLDVLKKSGGNYLRCTMSYRDEENDKPFKQLDDGKYDLDQYNHNFWNKFNFFLQECKKRDIVVQVEIWATYDIYSRHWVNNSYNPANNINYDTTNTSFKATLNRSKWPGDLNQKFPFYYTIPKLNNDTLPLYYQHRFVDKLLSISLNYDNVLYCIDNEIWYNTEWEWGWYWANHIKELAAKRNKNIYVTEMYCFAGPNPNFGERGINFIKGSFDHPEIYDYLDISQTGFKKRQMHWDVLRENYKYCQSSPRPINMVKIYGSDINDAGHCTSRKNGIEVFWRSVFGGLATARFHRPTCGQGLNKLAQNSISVMRKFEQEVKPWECKTTMDILLDREENEAYILANFGQNYTIYFTDSETDRSVLLDLENDNQTFSVKWLNIETGEWKKDNEIEGGEKVKIQSPKAGSKYGWVCLLINK